MKKYSFYKEFFRLIYESFLNIGRYIVLYIFDLDSKYLELSASYVCYLWSYQHRRILRMQ